jgi:hypothetical protein
VADFSLASSAFALEEPYRAATPATARIARHAVVVGAARGDPGQAPAAWASLIAQAASSRARTSSSVICPKSR